MNKTMRNFLIIVAIVLLVFAILLVVYQQFKTEPVDTNTIGNLIQNNANTPMDNIDDELLGEEDNNNEINEEENTQSSNQNTNQNTSSNSQGGENTNKESDTTPREDKAVELAKEAWKKDKGSTESVTFGNVSIQGNGKYVVCVSDNRTTASICFYIVDVDTGVVTER